MENDPKIPFALHPPDPSRRCTATSKRTRERCKNWAMRGKHVCRFHGGKSTGPKTAQGREVSRMSRLVHGNDALENLKDRIADRVIWAADRLAGDCLPFFDYARQKIAEMDYAEFRRNRPIMAAFCRDEITLYKLIEVLDGKRPKRSSMGLLDFCAQSYPILPKILEEELQKTRKRKLT